MMQQRESEQRGRPKWRTRIRSVRDLPEGVKKRLISYGIAAGAAGVSLLATATPARGDIIYTSVNKHFGPNSQVPIDLNHDGIVDFVLSNVGVSTCFPVCTVNGSLRLQVPTGNGVIITHTHFGTRTWAAALKSGDPIGGSRVFSGQSEPMGAWLRRFSTHAGPWDPCGTATCGGSGGGGRGFLGLKFAINGQTHYGWAKLVDFPDQSGGFTGTLVSFAYETVPNQGLLAGQGAVVPEPGTLGLLALGAAALGLWRKRNTK